MAIFNSYVKLPEGTGTQTHRDILMGKTMPFLPPMTGNGKFIPPIKKSYDAWGMVRANGIKWHCFIHIIADIPNTCLCQETFFPLSIDLITVLFEPATVQMSPTGPVMRSPSLENSNLFPFHVPKRFYWGANMPTSMEKNLAIGILAS